MMIRTIEETANGAVRSDDAAGQLAVTRRPPISSQALESGQC